MSYIKNIINKLKLNSGTNKPVNRHKINTGDLKRNSIVFVLVIYFLSILLNFFQFVPFSQTAASEPAIDNVKI
ncbi:MAG: hypothetical protein V3575_00805, partial [Candidatus Absconditabacteria bacterium]